MIKIFDQEFDKENLPQEITLGCGCQYKKDNCIQGISYTNVILCETHSYKVDIGEEKQRLLKKVKDDTHKRIIDKYDIYTQMNINNLTKNVVTKQKYTQAEKDAMNNEIDLIRQEGYDKQQLINACTTVEELQALEV